MTGGDAASRLASLTSWHADWSGLRVAVLGLGVTGFAAADTLAELGAHVLVAAEHADERRTEMLRVLGIGLAVAEDPDELVPALTGFAPELIVVSPGFHPDHPLLSWAAANGVAVWGDIELAWRVRDKTGDPADWILVTGTNGKTTTVRLTATMLVAAGLRAAPCGNIGVPVLDAVRDPAGFDALVVELSSYQLHWLDQNPGGLLSPHSSACLNIADDHLDWHGSFAAYRAAKATVYAHTRHSCVYNRADPETEAMVREADVSAGARAIGFGTDTPARGELGVVEGILCDRAFHAERATSALELCTLDELASLGLAAPHLVQDVLAASALARSYGVTVESLRAGLADFRLDPHRIEPVASAGGVRWIDDSKATNPHAAHASLLAFERIVWIAGGLLKGVEVEALVRDHADRLAGAVLIGADRDALRDAFRRHAPGLPLREVGADDTGPVMTAAVRHAAELAKAGDTVLLAPAAASMDQFTDYADRGRRFAEAVREQLGGEADDESAS